jgi:hypothetical protein
VLLGDAVGVAHQHVGSTAGAAQGSIGNRDVVPGEIELGVACFRKEHLAWTRDGHLAPVRCEEFMLVGFSLGGLLTGTDHIQG